MAGGRHVVFQGVPAYCDGKTLNIEFSREATGLDLRLTDTQTFRPAFTVGASQPGISRHGNIWFATAPPLSFPQWREIFQAAGAHPYVDGGEIIHAGAGLVLIHTKDGGNRRVTFRGGMAHDLKLPPKASWLFDSTTGERLL